MKFANIAALSLTPGQVLVNLGTVEQVSKVGMFTAVLVSNNNVWSLADGKLHKTSQTLVFHQMDDVTVIA